MNSRNLLREVSEPGTGHETTAGARSRGGPSPSPGAVALGSSLGGMEALGVCLGGLSPDFPLPLLVVQHLGMEDGGLIVDSLREQIPLEVVEVEDKEPIRRGVLHLAPPGYHLLVEDRATLALCAGERVSGSRPSIDVLFESAAEVWGPGLVVVALTSASSDGAAGARRVVREGGRVLVQDPDQARAPVLPRAVLEEVPGALCLGLAQIATWLEQLGGKSIGT